MSQNFEIWEVLIEKWPFFQFQQNSVLMASERDISCCIAQNIIRTKIVIIHEKIPDIITNAVGDNNTRH